MKELIKEFIDVAANPYKSVAELKEKKKQKVLGCFPMDIPEELINAAGILPVVLWESNELITIGHSRIMPFNCGLTRSVVDDAMKGKLDFLDGMLFCDTCLQARNLPFIIERNSKQRYLEYFYLPPILRSPAARDYLLNNLRKLKMSLEEFGGQRISDDLLNDSIEKSNRNRFLLRRLYELRQSKPGILRAAEVKAVVQAGLLMAKEDHNALLEKLIAKIEAAPAPKSSKIRAILAGYLCFAPRTDMLDLIEDCGIDIVDDYIYVGSRYFTNEIEVNGNPLAAMAKRFLSPVPPCPTKVDWESDWIDYIVEVYKRSKAQGVVTLVAKFCPPLINYYSEIRRKLASAGIPEVLLEIEHEIVSLEQSKTRVKAFVETIGGV